MRGLSASTGWETRRCHDDVIEVATRAGAHLDTIVVPKARPTRDVWWVDVLLTQLEAKLSLDSRFRLQARIAEVEGLANAEAIAVSSPRLDALIFGVGDFSLSQGARVDSDFVPLGDYPGDFWHDARNKIVVAARIAGIDAIDAPYPDYREPGRLRTRRSSCLDDRLHRDVGDSPRPGAVANEVYSPTDDEIALAERNLAAYREARSRAAARWASRVFSSTPRTSRWPRRPWPGPR